ncbi:methyltransferase domain-containing protein [Maribacter halichondriae]|uniref:methyltransferase domain-containing protein n=1 Tax=Maribacter halichondriae TaxID=2980554 RepID=UPI00235997B1|nr:methyltransferase domain-containing protein [Maribacter sp. Hal144]
MEDNFADLVISNNALEHTTHPLEELKELYRVLKPGGKIVFVVPCESISYSYKPNDINYHLYSWGPMCAGNLFNEAGFNVIESKAFKHKWPPKHRTIAKLFGRGIFNVACKIYARLETTWFQVRVVAEKK